MFQQWGFLLGEIWILLALAALLGLLAGWIIWGRRNNYKAEAALQAELDACRSDLKTCRGDLSTCRTDLDTCLAQPKPESVVAAPIAAPIVASPKPAVDLSEDYDGDGVVEGKNEGTRPEALSGPRNGKADDLKQIKGIGLKMEKLCNSLGFYHFDQIAGWTASETAWVDANLEGFKGRVTRDDWVAQAKVLAAGGVTEFSKKVSKGDVNY